MKQRNIWLVAAALVLVALVVGLLLPGEEASQATRVDAASPGAAAEGSAAAKAPKAAPRLPVPVPLPTEAVAAPPEEAPAAPPSARTANLVEQLVALHAIASQAEVSAFLERNAATAAEMVDAYCAAAEALPKRPSPPPEPPPSRDAAPFLAPLLDWETPKRQGSLHLPDALLAQTRGERWFEAIPAAEAQRDFGWLRALEGYDHWSLPPHVRQPDEGPDELVEIPSYVQLRSWLKLRWVRALGDGDLLDASRQAGHVRALLQKQGLLIAVMISIALEQDERTIFELALARGVQVPGWAPRGADELAEQRRLDRYGYAFLLPGVDPAVAKRALDCAPTPCAALVEGAWQHASLGELAPDNTSAAFWAMADARPDCNAALVKLLRSAPELPPERVAAFLKGEDPLRKAFPPKPR